MTAATTANRYTTSAVASLRRPSPSIIAISRRGRPIRFAISDAASGSVGATIAPSTNADDQDMSGTTACATTATVPTVAKTSPSESDAIGRKARRSSRTEV